ncbi:SusC/RagA family TonB-linked outer membrane protein [Psychroserpens burtonensis]|uniref:SusC/RagA family TonB-linked outer membrane protein n=1 Tax=Psychroserpens burtonensis TaxID=49278 RepID=A0A5C7B2V0_9FLAO|nr:SusC/RagA family TonB-linked outer membrane protein [Psychroserpens burtonensis]TXE15555.1 SusC/RagA family TonB-linked outer membrane protein [Psychroserpens burtonensis]
MKLKLTWLMTLFMAFVMQLSFAQEKTVTGTVTSAADGLPLPGVSVIVKGTSRGVQTDFDGNYSIKASTGETLVFSFVGMKKSEKKIGQSSTLNLAMAEDLAQLETVVITGYAGATNSSKITSAIATVSSESIEQIPINSIDQLLQGQAAGVNVNTGSGQPGQSATIVIRGRGSLNGDVEPLFIIDGVPVDQDNFRSLNQNDIETMSVLKDAAATAIYGNRGAGGVILITTKTGKLGSGVKVQYRSLYGVAVQPQARFDVMNASQFLTFQRDLLPGNQYGDTLSDADIARVAGQTNTDWTDIFFRNGKTKSHEITVTTGGEQSTSFTSVQYYEQEGITIGSGLKRFSFRNNFNTTSADKKFNFGTNLTLNYSVSNFVVDAARGGNTGGQLDNPFIVPYIGLPYLSPYNPDGSINIWGTGPTGAGGSGAYNADGTLDADGAAGFLNTPFLALNTAALNTDEEREIKVVARVFADYNFAKNLTGGASFGLDYTNEELIDIRSPLSIRGINTPNLASEFRGSQTEQFFRDMSMIANAFIRYDNNITEKLNLNAAVYGEYNYNNRQFDFYRAFGLNPGLPGSGSGFTSGSATEGDDSDVYNYIPDVGSSETELALASVFATLDLDYDGRFGLSGSIRNDATSRFIENRDGIFWSVSGRWNIDNESFMENADWLSTLKLRASYGVVGNQNLGFNNRYIGQQTVSSGSGYQNANSYVLGALIDPAIKWETTNQTNIGLSFGFWQNRVSGELDVYNNTTTDLFADKPLSLAGTGFSNVETNVGELNNRGIDLQISYNILRKTDSNPWDITLTANGNYNKNEVTSLPGGFIGNTLRTAEGRQARTWFLPRWAGVNPANGEPLYLDVEGNLTNTFSAANAVYLDKNLDPTYTGGFGTDIRYKGFSLNTLFSFQADLYKLNSSLAITEDGGLAGFANQSVTMLNAWTTPGQITDIPALSNGGLRAVSGDRYLENASFLRLRNVSLSYNIDRKILEQTNVFTGVRVFVQATNLFTWTEWRGFDPEGTGSGGFFDYPVPRTFTLGFDLTF